MISVELQTLRDEAIAWAARTYVTLLLAAMARVSFASEQLVADSATCGDAVQA